MTVPETIAHYNVLERIGAGGLGEVYRARDTKVGRTVALKLIEPAVIAEETRRLALADEARLASRLSHPNIATLFEAGNADGRMYLVYEFISGPSLRSVMAGGPMAPRRAVELCIQIADALADGHAAGLLHGDLRPETILVTAKGRAKLLDFGLWRWTRGGLTRRYAARSPESLAPEDSSLASYMSPEQVLGGEMDGRSDLFSLATILHEMLTGTNPFLAGNPSDTLMNVVTRTPPPPSSVNADVSAELDAVVAKAFAKDLSVRMQSAAAVSAELRRVAASLGSPINDRRDDFLLPVDDAADKVPTAIWIAGIVTFVVTAAVVWWLLRG